MTTYTTFMIGTTLGGMTALGSLATPVPDPKSTYMPWSKPVNLGNGLVQGLGWKTITWHWQIMKPAEVEQLRTFCSGVASAEVFIVTRQNVADAFKAYKAVMVWPTEDRDFLRRMDITFNFQRLEEQV